MGIHQIKKIEKEKLKKKATAGSNTGLEPWIRRKHGIGEMEKKHIVMIVLINVRHITKNQIIRI